ncbi:ACT domain-containing protein [Nanoarchaeota archaeon]
MKKAVISPEKFAIVKAKGLVKGAFANIDDGREITVILDQKKMKKKEMINSQKNYRLITFDMVLPFSMVGFIAKIADKLAKVKIPIFVISAYSTDHILVKEKNLKKALFQLKKLGFEVEE